MLLLFAGATFVSKSYRVQNGDVPVRTDSLPETLFGAAVPNNYGSNLRTLLAEMYDDKDYKTTQDTLEGLYQQQ
jgi:hypothetical protein